MAEEKAFLLPVVIDETRDAEARVPSEFKAVQWSRLPPPPGLRRTGRPLGYAGQTRSEGEHVGQAGVEGGDPALEKFCARVQKLLGVSAVLQPAPENPGRGLKRRATLEPRRRIPAVVLIATVVVVGGAAVYFGWRPGKTVAGDTRAPAVERSTGPAVERVRAILRKTDVLRAELELASELLHQAATANPTDAEVFAEWAMVDCRYLDEYYDISTARRQLARKHVAQAVALDATLPAVRLARAMAMGRVDDNEATRVEAAGILQGLIAELPADARIPLELGRVAERAGKPAEAREWFARAAKLPGHAGFAAYRTALSHLYEGDFRAAVAGVDQALAAEQTVKFLLWKSYFRTIWLGDPVSAKRTLAAVPAEVFAEDMPASARFLVEMFSRDFGQALAAMRGIPRDYLQSGALHIPTGYNRGLALSFLNKRAGAENEWSAALSVVERRLLDQPNESHLLLAKAILLAALGDKPAAAKLRATLIELQGEDPLDWRQEYLAFHLLTEEEALDRMEAFARKGARLFPAAVYRLYPLFDRLRTNPRFIAFQARVDADPRYSPTAPPAAAEAKVDEKSVAVLAFRNIAGDPNNDAIVEGIGAELISVLGRVPGLTVRGNTSLTYFKGSTETAQEKGRKLDATYLVDGSVQRAGDTVRIAANLTHAATNKIVWTSSPLTRDVKNLFAVQEEIAGLIVQNLSLKLGARSAASTAAVNPQAFELYVQARQAWGMRTIEGFAQAELLLKQALMIDPDFARAHAALADVWTTGAGAAATLGLFRLRGSPVILKSTTSAQRAIQLDPQLAEAHTALGGVAWHDWRVADAEAALRRAVMLNANYASAHQWLGRVLATAGRMDEALVALRRAHDLDPLSHKIADNLGIILFSAGRYTEALGLADRAQALQPNSPWAAGGRAWALAELGRGDAAIAAVRSVDGETPATWKGHVAFALARAGARSEAKAMLERIDPADRSASAAAAALVLGRLDECWSALEQGSRNILSADALLFWPAFDPIRSEARFQKMLTDLGLTEAHARAQAWRVAHPPEKSEAKR
jgi:TolB-like protein/Flp pilus assembly protein TadD